jgi:hypothetical protein
MLRAALQPQAGWPSVRPSARSPGPGGRSRSHATLRAPRLGWAPAAACVRAWRGTALGGGGGEAVAHGHPLAPGWGLESPAWGRSEAAEWTAPRLPAGGLLSTSGPWSGEPEVGAAGGGTRWEREVGDPVWPGRGLGVRGGRERGWAPPDNAPGDQSPAEGLRLASPPPRPPRHRR